MSKKSRRRNKKLLAILALAGGAAMMGRRKRIRATDSPGNAKAAAVKAMTSDAAYSPPTTAVTGISKPDTSGPFITKKEPTQGFQSRYKKKVDGRWMGPGEIRIAAAKERKYETGEHSIPNLDPYKIPTKRVHVGRGVFKHGGKAKVTGIAKRGFGRALKTK